jgi:hypothetical protein
MVQEKALILSFALFILLLSCILLTPHNALRAVMSHYTLYFLLIAFSVFGVLLLGNHMELSRPFRGVSMKSWIILLSIMVMAFYLYMVSGYCASESRILWEYVFSAGGMLKGEVDLLHPDGYSFILMMLFSVFGNNYGGILILSALITSLTAFAVFLITYYIFRSEGAALLAALVFSLLPNNIMYTQGLVPQVPSLLFVSLSFLFLMISIDTNKTRAYSLSLATLIIAVSMRIENIMFTVLFVIGFLAFRKQTDTRKLRWPLMLFIFLMLQFSYFYIYADNLFGAESFLEFRGPDIPTFSLLNIPEKLPLYA